MEKNKNFLALDLLRGIAAFLVFIGHLRAMMFTNYETTGRESTFTKAFLFITGFGHQAVVIFFVLSGFFIAKTIDEKLTQNKWKFKNYFIDRIVRLWTVLLAALVLLGGLDYFGIQFFGNTVMYNGGITFLPDVNPKAHLGALNFIGNLFFLQTIYVPTWGSNGALWSLANEFWYYMLYGAFVFGFVNRKNKTKLLIAFISIAGITYITWGSILQYFLIWLLGVAVYYAKKKVNIQITALTILSIVLVAAVLGLIRLNFKPQYFNDYTLSIVVSVLIYCLANSYNFSKIITVFTKWLSNISYTLYVVHMPICLFTATALGWYNQKFSTIEISKYFLVMVIVLIIVQLFWYLFEKNTNLFKQKIKIKLGS